MDSDTNASSGVRPTCWEGRHVSGQEFDVGKSAHTPSSVTRGVAGEDRGSNSEGTTRFGRLDKVIGGAGSSGGGHGSNTGCNASREIGAKSRIIHLADSSRHIRLERSSSSMNK